MAGKVSRGAARRRPALRRVGRKVPPLILLDTDVLIDVALDRRPHADPAAELLDRIESGAEKASIAWHSISNLYYVVVPNAGKADTLRFISELTRFVDVSATGTEDLRYALGLPMDDFEDAMQVAAARSCGSRLIATRNVKDYARSPIRALNPRDVLEELE